MAQDLGRILYTASTVIYTKGMIKPIPSINVKKKPSNLRLNIQSAIPAAEKQIWTNAKRKTIYMSIILYTVSMYGRMIAARIVVGITRFPTNTTKYSHSVQRQIWQVQLSSETGRRQPNTYSRMVQTCSSLEKHP